MSVGPAVKERYGHERESVVSSGVCLENSEAMYDQDGTDPMVGTIDSNQNNAAFTLTWMMKWTEVKADEILPSSTLMRALHHCLGRILI